MKSPYLFAHDPADPQTLLMVVEPMITAKVLQFSSEAQMQEFIDRKEAESGFIGAQVEGYSILIVPGVSEWPADTNWYEMAAYFYKHKVRGKERNYKNCKL